MYGIAIWPLTYEDLSTEFQVPYGVSTYYKVVLALTNGTPEAGFETSKSNART